MTNYSDAKSLVAFKGFRALAQVKRSAVNERPGEIGGQKLKGVEDRG
jgi:hypothetical protein